MKILCTTMVLVISGCATHLTEKEKFFEKHPTEVGLYKQFNLTSKETEIYHGENRNLSLVQLARTNPNSERDFEAMLDEMDSELHTFWDLFSSGVDERADLYFVYRKEYPKEFMGYYYLLDGEIVKKDGMSLGNE